MRCPYCQGLNPDTARFCVRCGRDFAQTKRPQKQVQSTIGKGHTVDASPWPIMPPEQAFQRYTVPTPEVPVESLQQPSTPVVAPPPEKSRKRQRQSKTESVRTQQETRSAATSTIETEPPCPREFPPSTIKELLAFADLAVDYSLITEGVDYGKKHEVRIAYKPCPSWQQVATLLKALKEHNAANYEIVVVQGFQKDAKAHFLFDNGQLTFDRNARLGNQVFERYLIETYNGYDSKSERIIVTEKAKR